MSETPDPLVGKVPMAQIESCDECGFGWMRPEDERHAEGCPGAGVGEINTRFKYHAPTIGMSESFLELRLASRDLAVKFMLRVPDCRERSLAIRKLEEAVMWANAGIARRS